MERHAGIRSSLVISALAHACVVFTPALFIGKALDAPPTEALPVNIISITEFTELTRGQNNTDKVTTAQPLAEKVADPKPAETLAPVSDDPPDDSPPQQQAEARPDESKKQLEEQAKPADSKMEPEWEIVDEEALKKAETKEPVPLPRPKPVQQQPKSAQIPGPIDADTHRQVASADALSSAPSLGSTRHAVVLSLSELDALREKLKQCWIVPIDAPDTPVLIHVAFNPDGTLAGPPQTVRGPSSIAEGVKRALVRCQPYKMLRAETYHIWKDFDMTFHAKD